MAKIGDPIPNITLRMKKDDAISEVTTEELFKGKKIAVFSVPGAFTPTCTERHLPGFIKKSAEILARCDGLYCIAVNDVFVLSAWEKHLNSAGKITLLSDGNAEFAKALKMDYDFSNGGLGTRMQRSAMIIDDMAIRWLKIDEPGMLEHARAENLLSQL